MHGVREVEEVEVTRGGDDAVDGGEVGAPSLRAARSPLASIPRGRFPEQHTHAHLSLSPPHASSPAREDTIKTHTFCLLVVRPRPPTQSPRPLYLVFLLLLQQHNTHARCTVPCLSTSPATTQHPRHAFLLPRQRNTHARFAVPSLSTPTPTQHPRPLSCI